MPRPGPRNKKFAKIKEIRKELREQAVPLIEDLLERTDMTEADLNFVDELDKTFRNGGTLSQKEFDILFKIYDRYMNG